MQRCGVVQFAGPESTGAFVLLARGSLRALRAWREGEGERERGERGSAARRGEARGETGRTRREGVSEGESEWEGGARGREARSERTSEGKELQVRLPIAIRYRYRYPLSLSLSSREDACRRVLVLLELTLNPHRLQR